MAGKSEGKFLAISLRDESLFFTYFEHFATHTGVAQAIFLYDENQERDEVNKLELIALTTNVSCRAFDVGRGLGIILRQRILLELK